MPTLVLITLILVSPFVAISLLPALRDNDEGEDAIVRWRK